MEEKREEERKLNQEVEEDMNMEENIESENPLEPNGNSILLLIYIFIAYLEKDPKNII
jgi:hypothetical protein